METLRNHLLNAEDRKIQSGLESWESWEMNYGPHQYCLWLTSFEYLQEHLGIEATYFHPKSEGLLNFFHELHKDFPEEEKLPLLRLVALPEYRKPHMRVVSRFEGRYKWNLFIDWMTAVQPPGIRGSYWLSVTYRQPDLPDDPNEVPDLVQHMEEKHIGGNFTIRADVEGWIDLVSQIINLERENNS